MVRRRAWLLNLDADDELARPAGYTPAAAVAARASALAPRLAGLLAPGDVLLHDPASAALPPGEFAGRAWCPTPRALALLRRAGAEPPPAPPLDVLRRVNHRAFCAALGQELPGARYVTALAELEAVVAGPSPSGQWLLKRPFGFAGRGRRRVAAGPLDAPARAWVLASLAAREGADPASAPWPWAGLQVEPWVERRGDFSNHGHVAAEDGTIRLGAPCVQRCDSRGAWQDTRRAEMADLAGPEHDRLEAAALEAGRALCEAGYFGPFGIDAFRWADAGGALHFCARCEINARYTMGWVVGMGDVRPDLT